MHSERKGNALDMSVTDKWCINYVTCAARVKI